MPRDEQRIAQVRERQRAARIAYLAALPEDVAEILGRSPVRYFPDGAEIVAHGFVTKSGVGSEVFHVPAGYRYREVGWLEKAIANLDSFTAAHDGEPAFLWPLGVDGERRSRPAFDVNFGWARAALRDLLVPAKHGLALLTSNFEAGIVLSVVIGYVPGDFNPAEVVCELGTWTPHENSSDRIGPN